jgi:hypothetical protein
MYTLGGSSFIFVSLFCSIGGPGNHVFVCILENNNHDESLIFSFLKHSLGARSTKGLGAYEIFVVGVLHLEPLSLLVFIVL